MPAATASMKPQQPSIIGRRRRDQPRMQQQEQQQRHQHDHRAHAVARAGLDFPALQLRRRRVQLQGARHVKAVYVRGLRNAPGHFASVLCRRYAWGVRVGLFAFLVVVALCGCGYTEQPSCEGLEQLKSRDVVVIPDHRYEVLDIVVDNGPCSAMTWCTQGWNVGNWCGTFSGGLHDSCTLTVDFLDESGTRRRCTATVPQRPSCGNPQTMYLQVDSTPGRPACWTSSATIADASTAFPVDAGAE